MSSFSTCEICHFYFVFFIHLEAITHIDREQIEDEEENTEPMIVRCTNSDIASLAHPIHEENEQERYATIITTSYPHT